MKRVILTGAGGFIGAHCIKYWMDTQPDWEIICLDSFRNKGYISRLCEAMRACAMDANVPLTQLLTETNRLKIFTHDLTVPIDQPLENLILGRKLDDRGVVTEKPIDIIINMASDSAVERSTTDPTHCLRNNYDLMVNMLEFARRIKPKVFIQISTDEVYGEAPPLPSPGHKEWSTIMPSNPYAASKAAQEALAISYWRTYDLPLVLTNCMNIIGEWQDPEKFLPKIIQFVAQSKEMPVYADRVMTAENANHSETVDPLGNAGVVNWYIGSRVYLDARNKADALAFISKRPVARYSQGAKQPDRYNICGDTELNNLEMAQKVAKIMNRDLKYKLVPSESARPGYDRRYALDGSKLRSLGWTQPYTFDQTLGRIVNWTLQNHHWLA